MREKVRPELRRASGTGLNYRNVAGVETMRGTVFEFALEVDQQIASLTREQYYLRTGRAKILLEELYPLSRFALRLQYPGIQLEVEAFEDDGPIDGVLRWKRIPESETPS